MAMHGEVATTIDPMNRRRLLPAAACVPVLAILIDA